MRDAASLKFRPVISGAFPRTGTSGATNPLAAGVVRVLLGFICLLAICGVGAPLVAQEKKPQPTPAPTPHIPLAGKACSDCHKRVVSSKAGCLLARADLCEFCHRIPVEGGVSKLVKASEPLCFQCHKKEQFKGNFVHGPFAAGACSTCHDPHGGNVPGMLRSTGPAMCLDCHKDMSAGLSEARMRHKPTDTGCLDCHDPHLSDQPHLLKAALPGLCGNCHEKVVKDLQTAVVKHSPVTEGPACMNCHNPHAAQNGDLLIAEKQDLCLRCHDQPVKAGKQEVPNVKQMLAGNPFLHGPLQDRHCSACHNPHGSPYFQALTNHYPQEFYAPFFVSNYDLCFRCHEAALTTEERTSRATAFRDGDRNLHFVHVNRTSHGRSCRACHEVHASATPELIGATVPFGDWKLPLKFAKTENGGSCAPACHSAQQYDRRTGKSTRP